MDSYKQRQQVERRDIEKMYIERRELINTEERE